MDAQLLTLLVGTMLLGLRHGIDWDHVAALLDIAGGCGARAFMPAMSYALGHALVVVLLGVCALQFASILPPWVDPIMRRLVGVTLVLLSAWVFYQVFCSRQVAPAGQTEPAFVPLSRGLMMWRFGTKLSIWLRSAFAGSTMNAAPASAGGISAGLEGGNGTYDVRAAFGIGMLHGIGAETGSQVLLLTAVGSASSQGMGFILLGVFVLGLVMSNMIVAWLAVAGLLSARCFRPVYTGVALLVAVFSLLVGTYFIIGQSQNLPNVSSKKLNFFASRDV